MNITSNDWRLTLDLVGGRIQELSYQGIKIFGTYQRMDGKGGNTHICAPSFDKEGQEKYGLPFHGYARTLTWTVNQQTANTISISATTSFSELYPASLQLVQTFVLGEYLSHTVDVAHLSGAPVPVNIGMHYYWDTPLGWQEVQIQNQNIREKIEANGFMDLQEKSFITFPHARYELLSNGFRSVMLWTSFKSEGTEEKLYSQDFCCIEPIIEWPHFFGSDKSVLYPKKTVSASIRLRKVV